MSISTIRCHRTRTLLSVLNCDVFLVLLVFPDVTSFVYEYLDTNFIMLGLTKPTKYHSIIDIINISKVLFWPHFRMRILNEQLEIHIPYNTTSRGRCMSGHQLDPVSLKDIKINICSVHTILLTLMTNYGALAIRKTIPIKYAISFPEAPAHCTLRRRSLTLSFCLCNTPPSLAILTDWLTATCLAP